MIKLIGEIDVDMDRLPLASPSVAPDLSTLILQRVVSYLVHDKCTHTRWKVRSLATVSKLFFRTCSSILSKQVVRSIGIASQITHLGADQCLFTQTPLHLKTSDLVHIPPQHIVQCLDRVESLVVPFCIDNSDSMIYYCNLVQCRNLRQLRIIQQQEDVYDHHILNRIRDKHGESPFIEDMGVNMGHMWQEEDGEYDQRGDDNNDGPSFEQRIMQNYIVGNPSLEYVKIRVSDHSSFVCQRFLEVLSNTDASIKVSIGIASSTSPPVALPDTMASKVNSLSLVQHVQSQPLNFSNITSLTLSDRRCLLPLDEDLRVFYQMSAKLCKVTLKLVDLNHALLFLAATSANTHISSISIRLFLCSSRTLAR
ncbi:hypothetical protein SAMD00019534_039300 [Acytostelium subglobosum LB1]|uniref:hypothetical protein n=1 Tax=Acytostelium subglobosum LB1 TaxID=1410327 RepID=UPI000644AAC7|nr:hypothetical protein SAMD00019534_039300 [Acytostelium subglobosum LB1]GAM20755.1 hypothetical protein SAMD00019534_039300 [Acytostelium subglobosum LB1]|eukprot:XP_012755889.1 hypothetical protein SAMD00019534_039300 [Acytostelium subglobosum LB1]